MAVSPEQKKNIAKIAKKYNLKLVLIFGSRISKKTHQESDLDIGILTKKVFSFKKHLSIISDFENIFHIQPDITTLNHADPLLLRKIIENSLIIYGKPRDFAEFKMNAFFQFCDYKPYFKLEEKIAARFIENLIYDNR